ncbi:MAG: EI24 domain-containing protein [Beutenbergiaceae bacterium]
MTSTRPGVPAAIGQFLGGVGLLGRGFGWWRRRPAVMAASLIPAVIVAMVLFAGFIGLLMNLEAIAEFLTPFADDWNRAWSALVRVGVGFAVVVGAGVLVVTTFTGLTLLVGEPFYDRIWRSVEAAYGEIPSDGYRFWQAARDSLSLIVRGAGIALLSLLLGFIPLVGAVIATLVGVCLSGWVISDELTSRALSARGLDNRVRQRLRRARRARVWGFGVASHLLLLIPFSAILTVPAAVAGSTMLARELLEPDPG